VREIRKAGKGDSWEDNLQTGNKLEAIHVPVNLAHYAPITRLRRAKDTEIGGCLALEEVRPVRPPRISLSA